MQDDPSAERLLGAIADTLERRVLDELEGSARHQVRVVVNLCRILEREHRLDPKLDADALSLVSALMAEDFDSAPAAWEALASRIDEVAARSSDRARSGESVDEDRRFLTAAHAVAMTVVRGKLAVVTPGYDNPSGDKTTDRR